MSDIIDTVQLQETDDALLVLFDITLPNGTLVYLFNGLDEGDDNLYFPQKALDTESSSSTYNKYPLKEYVSMPIDISGIEVSGTGASNRPMLTMANIPVLSRSIVNNSDGVDDEYDILDLLAKENLTKNEDLLGSRVSVRRTLASKTYRRTDTAPSSSPVEFPTQSYIIDRVASESNILAEFELANPMDVEGVKLPNRVVIGKYCPWRYQGHFLPDNEGNPSKDGGCIWPLDSEGRFFDIDNNVITKDITTITAWTSSATFSAGAKVKTITNGHTQIWEALRAVPANKEPFAQKFYWKRLDVCGKTLTSCKLRFQGNNTNDVLDTKHVLPFGGFPGTKQFK